MLSHLRFHRRAPSNPSSPTPDQVAAWEGAAHHDHHPESAQDMSPNPLQASQPLPSPMAPRPDAPDVSESPVPIGNLSRSKPPPPPINTGLAGRPVLLAAKQAKTTSFVAPTELQQASATASVNRPAKTRLSSEPASLPSSSSSAPPPETQKPRKGLPFLKNPVSSLLMRRKSSQAPIDLKPVDTTPSYDPRIRGTRVHDFSAPRKRVVPNPATTQVDISSTDTPGVTSQSPQPEAFDHALSRLSLTDKPVPPVPPKDGTASSVHTLSSKTSKTSIKGQSPTVDPRASVRSTASRAFSLSSRSVRNSIMSAVPKHMKSTSSRFSFDMIGSAKQEKLLEERHRQREQGKKTPDLASPARDSRYDDFDEDFDYDAMLDDDGLEEPIPGVNADYDDVDQDFEASMDPDNDQENFAGFVFQRSNPASALASPHTPAVLATPRDANGKVIGFAMTKDITPDVPTPVTADAPALPKFEDATSGLGIHMAEDKVKESTPEDSIYQTSHQPAQVPAQKNTKHDDDIYFDDGLRDELDFQDDGFVFDESIFDNNDTDQYGRPIPGAFAQAQEAMRAVQLQLKRESDLTSDLSRQSAIPQSTTHTSISVGPEYPVVGKEQSASGPGLMMSMPGQDLAYQAALAEAAQKAAASGKFRRGSSPPPAAELTITSPTDSAADSLHHSQPDNSLDHYEDDYDDGGFDSNYDFDFDDEAIIAEANASALANDSDGWYGQEFGFYSAPIPGGNGNRDPNPSALSAENLFSYANGGYFGPAGGLARTTSGRVVSREPNLTPITERSEYSNRNSIMSLTLPPVIGSAEGPGTGARNSLGSPGLAQLALMGLDDADSTMSLSALMKLRNKAWGGSQASLPSSREGSPRSERAPPGGGEGKGGGDMFAGHLHASNISGHARKGSSFSLWTENGDVSTAAGGNGSGGSPVTTATNGGLFAANNLLPGGVVLSPLPQRPGMNMGMGVGMGMGGIGGMFSPSGPIGSIPPLLAIPSPLPQGLNGGMSSGFACSPVLEDEEVENGLAGYEDEDEYDGYLEEDDVNGDEEDGNQKNNHHGGLAPALPVDGFVDVSCAAKGMGHKHKGSADSISYTAMDDGVEGGGKRWVVERRRMGDAGEVEILGREVVEGGRI
ncbi:hypothetical protein QBC38DRAFT_476198 [Podospora fimiseda]|uniref:Uncharacterized protein n=1 Tax=Podospora fimiseda TaxID=252190 RepID=A0AAN7BRA4_9PEZI|nr:hypothetical protein QBC38DRAFT_476198 [Podospora fimiseda]